MSDNIMDILIIIQVMEITIIIKKYVLLKSRLEHE